MKIETISEKITDLREPSNGSNPEVNARTEIDKKPILRRFELSNRFLFGFFKFIGFINVYWENDRYFLNKFHFAFSYTLWFLLPAFLYVSSFNLKSVTFNSVSVNDEDQQDIAIEEDKKQESSTLSNLATVFLIAVVPSMQAYIIKLVNVQLPSTLYKMAEIDGMYPNKKTRMRIIGIFFPFISLSKNARKKGERLTVLTIFPAATIIVSMTTFWYLTIDSVVAAFETLDSKIVFDEWLVFTLVIVYSFMVYWSNRFCAVFLEWFRRSYSVIHKVINQAPDEELTAINNSLDLIHECFAEVQNSFMAYIFTLNTVISTVSLIIAFIKVTTSLEMIFYFIPLYINAHLIWSMCLESSRLIDQVQ